ncbi:hypothetical protein ACFQPC_04725 [Herminiimonas glaciei]|uniref:HTH-type transcriptional regulator/antitoxin HigA n=1 Tax=Herminiimonas glaciei TaxID=523788 RepID=A0ABW2I8N2_9BURK
MNFPPESQALNPNEVDYLHMIQRFDQLWASARTEHEQAEMQRLLYLIEQYETEKHDNRDSGMSSAPENPDHRQGSFETPMRSTQ